MRRLDSLYSVTTADSSTPHTGCFENYLGARQLTDTWPRILEATDWLFLYDRLDGRLRSDRDYELLAYVPYAFVPWYKLFSSQTSAPMEFPKADYEVSFGWLDSNDSEN